MDAGAGERVTPTVSVILPCLDEADNVPLLVEAFLEASAECGVTTELCFVDDGSSDGTADRVREQASKIDGSALVSIRLVCHDVNRGIAAAWRTGVADATGTYACLFDADMQNDPRDVYRLLARLEDSRADLVQGTRSTLGQKGLRLRASRVLRAILNLAFGSRLKDPKSGFMLGPRFVIGDTVAHRKRYRYFQSFLGVSALSKGYRIAEVETRFRQRGAGSSFIVGRWGVFKVSMGALLDVPKALGEFGRRRRHPLGFSIDKAIPSQPGKQPSLVAKVPYRGWRRLRFGLFFFTMPLHKWMIRRSSRRLYLELKSTEWLDAGDLERLRERKLKRLVQHAYTRVPHYRDAMRSRGVRPPDIGSLADIAKLPYLTKDDLRRDLYFDLFADDYRAQDVLEIATSGSTATPLTTYGDRYQLEVRFATTLRAAEWTGWRIGDRQARLWHQTLGMSRSQVFREKMDARFMRRIFIPAYEIDGDNIDRFIDRIRKHDPVLVDGYAESLNFLAQYVASGRSPGFSPKAMMSSAQELPEHTRRQIEAGFDTRVFDKYGSREFSGIAYQCDSSPDHHVMDESYIVEILVDNRPARPGEVGEIVVTDLNNYSVPLIRYRIGDLAEAVDNSVPCLCGRNLTRIGRIVGRTQAIVHCADGTWLPGTFFAHFFKDYGNLVLHYQIHQTVRGEFTLRIVPHHDYLFSTEQVDEMVRSLKEYTGTDTGITVEMVEEIPMGRTGKRSPVVSTVKAEFQELERPSGATVSRE